MAIDKLSANAFATGAIANSLGYTPANLAGDNFTGDLSVPNTKAYQVKDSGGTARYALYMSSGVSPAAGNNLVLGNPLANSVLLFANNTTAVTIVANGSVGVGTSTPSNMLHVAGSKTGNVAIIIQNGAASTNDGATLQLMYGSTEIGSMSWYWTGSQFQNKINYYGDLAFTNQGTEKLRFAANGYVGFGNTAPAEALHIQRTGGDNALVRLVTETGQAGVKMYAGSGVTNRATRIDFFNGVASTTTPRWVLINDYNQGGANDFQIVDAAGNKCLTIKQNGYIAINSDSVSTNYYVTLGTSGAGLTSSQFVHRWGSGTGSTENISYGGGFYLHHDNQSTSNQGMGNIACGRSTPAYCAKNTGGPAYYADAGGFTGPSDYRLKENIVPITDGITRVKLLKPIIFDYTDEAHWEDGNARHDGFLAHEVKEVVFDAVFGEKDGVDEDGKMIIQSLDKSRLVPVLTAALKEAIDKIEILEAKVAALEGNV